MNPAKAALSKHALITQALEQDLADGKYQVGATLPSEPDLTHQFGVSRHTVRAALRTLQERGLIASQQGLGSIVRATTASRRYAQGFASAEDLLQYVAGTRVVSVQRHELYVVDAELAAWLGCKPGEHWWHVVVLRNRRDEDTPATLADVYLPYAYGSLITELTEHDRPIFQQLEAQFGESITEIRQEISAAMPTPPEAAALQVSGGEPVLVIVRRYIGRHGQVLETTRTLHQASRFTYSMNLQLASGRQSG